MSTLIAQYEYLTVSSSFRHPGVYTTDMWTIWWVHRKERWGNCLPMRDRVHRRGLSYQYRWLLERTMFKWRDLCRWCCCFCVHMPGGVCRYPLQHESVTLNQIKLKIYQLVNWILYICSTCVNMLNIFCIVSGQYRPRGGTVLWNCVDIMDLLAYTSSTSWLNLRNFDAVLC